MMDRQSINIIPDLAYEYFRLSFVENARSDNETIVEILDKLVSFNAFEATYFCQQLVSYIPDFHRRSLELTILGNRILERMAKP